MIYVQTRSLNPLQKALAMLLGLSMLVLGVVFSVILIPLVALLAAIGIGFFWWKTRALRKAMADIRQQHEDCIIDGEAVVVSEHREVRRLSE
jgi:Flp pilus assembly protein TadB